jgi:hypothetical protein
MALTARDDWRRALRNILNEVYEVLWIKEKPIAIGLQLRERRLRVVVGVGEVCNGDFFQRKEETDEKEPKRRRGDGLVHRPDRVQ